MHPGRLTLKYQTRVEGTVTTTTLAYSGTELIMTEDIFFDAGTMANFITLFMDLIYECS
jgi:hypothetical protein